MQRMSNQAPPDMSGVDIDAYRQWKPEHQQRALELLREYEARDWKPFYCPNRKCDGSPHKDSTEWQFNHARSDQRPPPWKENWLSWALSGGRGSGKTRTGAEVVIGATKIVPRIALIAPTGPDLRMTMVEGISGILACCPPDNRPLWEPSKKQLTWNNGCIMQGFSAEEPDRLRGPQHGLAWLDEPAHYPNIEAVWYNLKLGLRLGSPSHAILTSTPKPSKWLKALLKDKRTINTRVSTYANLANLDPAFKETILDTFEGTRLGRQELHGEVLEDVEGSLWKFEMIQHVEEADAPEMTRIVVAVDPAGTANKRSDETGIIVIGIADKRLYVLADRSGKYSPKGWADAARQAYVDFSADAIVAEKNYGGDMVRHTLETSGWTDLVGRVIEVTSRRGKVIRAEPIVALYEKRRVYHVSHNRGDLLLLEEEMTEWVPGEGASPNRVDAMVHGATELGRHIIPAAVASPNEVLRGRMSSPTGGSHLRAV